MFRNSIISSTFLTIVAIAATGARGQDLPPGVRGLATRAPDKVMIDGDLSEFADAFCTPVNYFHPNVGERAGQFLYMWDEEAFYAGLRTLDTQQANPAPDNQLWEGDAVEWYFDTRRGPDFRAASWGPGAVHMYWTGYKNAELNPRWCLRPDMLSAIPGAGVEVGSRRTPFGAQVEFKLPWKNFPDFKVKEGEVIALDAELCYSDGASRVDRTFAFGSPLSVQQPASQGRIALVNKIEPGYWKACGPVAFPIRCDTAWGQPERGSVTAQMAVPPTMKNSIGKIVFRLLDPYGQTIGDQEATIQTLNEDGGFYRAEAHWPIDTAAPGGYLLLGIVHDKQGNELTRVAPRLVSVGMAPGY